ncbi:hypothetical protein [Methylosoma difficile]
MGSTLEFWRMQYRTRRYLEHLNEDELVKRFKDLLANITALTEADDMFKIGLQPITEGGGYWAELGTHILEECVLREYEYPAPFAYKLSDSQIPKHKWPGLQKAQQAFKLMNLKEGSFLVKFGKYEYLRPTLDTGLVRIMPASYYDDPSLNSAIRDSELEVSIFGLPSETKIEAICGKTGESKVLIEPIGNIKYTRQSSTNYYAYCLASAYSPRLFGDFEADCCLIIKNPCQFVELLMLEFYKKYPDFSASSESVHYFDPLNAKSANLDVFFSKHFRYSYQKEYRIIWLPPKAIMALEPVFLELGSLSSFCEIISLV